VSIFTDCVYPAENINSALKTAFGCEQGLLELPQTAALGIRVGIPVATVRGSSLCLFTSYNGTDRRKGDLGSLQKTRSLSVDADSLSEYHIIESHDRAKQPRVWEV
jgi:hypothetical protein